MLLLMVCVILNTVFLVSSETGYGDPCTVTDFAINGPFDVNHNALNLTILNDCTNGSVYWNYPEGTAILSAKRPDTVFDLCIESSWATVLEGVDLKTGTADGKLQVPTEGNPTCIHSVQGVAAFILIAPHPMRYLTIFDYKIISSAAE